jgi:hypothetical protein
MKGGRDEAGRVTDEAVGHLDEQLDEPPLVRRLDREDVDERDELLVLRSWS